ncbi:hypothetical protein SAMN05444143_103181 [Flavobacterium succinicans]|jgi:hypothetical protein|uniref:Lipid A phosphoethanolamine transferase n=1 Tax=Flavobacterium succinicans TaxID=29536 RepID=A0A1I4UHU6_9FLAO|nr:hypothetical protein SAMN05444143_103181 [Flavobacterium succinicans]
MQKLILLFLALFFYTSSVNAQDKKKIREEQNPFSEARFNYFKETIILFNEYLDTKNGSFNTTTFRLLKPIGNRAWTIRFDTPLVSTNSSTKNKTGLGDLSIATSFIPFLTKTSGIATRVRLIANTATDRNFGLGKWVVVPAIFYGTFIDSAKNIVFITDLEYQYSIAGDTNRDDVRITVLENSLIYSFSKNWMSANISFRYNEVLNGFQNSTFIEFGRKITPDSFFYIHPSLAFGNKKAYNYGFEVGMLIRY